MTKITKEQYEFALARVEELLPLVDDSTPANDKSMVELSVMSDIVIAYEKEHFPIEKPTVAELIELSLEEKGMTQKQLASEILYFGSLGTYFKNSSLALPGTQYTPRCHVGILKK